MAYKDCNLDKIDIKSLREDEIANRFKADGLPSFRASQVYRWLGKGVKDFGDMTDISKQLRESLSIGYFIPSLQIEQKRVSKIDGTAKYLFKLGSGEYIESVLMKYKHGYSVCISSQIGCKMNCSFCATGDLGFIANLSAGEMISQVSEISKDIKERISNIVIMGMGEPLDNYDNLLRFLDIVSSENSLNIGMRHISVSTCGLVDKIYDLADRKMQITLSVSLHAPNDEIRRRIMPVSKTWSVDELIEACRYYSGKTGRRISFEYAMIKGLNDTALCAKELALRLKGIISHVNLIPLNDTQKKDLIKSSDKSQKVFLNILERSGIAATIRRTLGPDIEASCGQLRAGYENRSIGGK